MSQNESPTVDEWISLIGKEEQIVLAFLESVGRVKRTGGRADPLNRYYELPAKGVALVCERVAKGRFVAHTVHLLSAEAGSGTSYAGALPFDVRFGESFADAKAKLAKQGANEGGGGVDPLLGALPRWLRVQGKNYYVQIEFVDDGLANVALVAAATARSDE